MVGRLERVQLRDVWKHEALDLTTWLVENPDVLTDVIGREFSNLRREQAAGAFAVDILAEDADGRVVVVENQLERSNHDHLGKLITYMAMFSAKVAIWIVSDPRPEHVTAIGWLNESGLCEFYLLKLEAVRIGLSEPAPLLTLITGPSESQRDVGESKKEYDAERYGDREAFWREVLTLSNSRSRLFSAISPTTRPYLTTSSGRKGVTFVYSIKQNSAAVELYIDTGIAAENTIIFDALRQRSYEIERAFGGPLKWEPLDGKRACRIRHAITLGGYRSTETRSELTQTMVADMHRLEAAIRPELGVATPSNAQSTSVG